MVSTRSQSKPLLYVIQMGLSSNNNKIFMTASKRRDRIKRYLLNDYEVDVEELIESKDDMDVNERAKMINQQPFRSSYIDG